MRADRGRWGNWGLFPVIPGTRFRPSGTKDVIDIIQRGGHPVIPRGNGRCYGDASLAQHMVSGLDLDVPFTLDERNATVSCGAGVLLDEILTRIVPRGFFLPVTPGTRFVTVGGAIAADVHGKNHHKDGAFGAFVEHLTMVTHDGEIVECGPDQEAELFHATCGGMGLTGMIISARFRVIRIETSWIRQRSERCRDLATLLGRFEATQGHTYSVAWIDLLKGGRGLGRSVLLLGEHARLEELPPAQRGSPLRPHGHGQLRIPFFLPPFVLGPWSIRVFNLLYYHKPSSSGERLVHYAPYFYPLDALLDWNRIYGRRGFLQYQFALPFSAGKEGLSSIIEALREARIASFLSVLKVFGPGDERKPLSFPMEGWTLALDIPFHPRVLPILDRLDEQVESLGGRIYLAKDARMHGPMLKRMYPGFSEFQRIRTRWGADRFASMQSERLGITTTNMDNTFDPKRVLILGATSDVAQAIARIYAQRGHSLTLAAREPGQLAELIAELGAKVAVTTLPFDALRTEEHPAFYNALDPKPGIVVAVFGHLPDQATAEDDHGEAVRTMAVNYLGAASILEEAARDLEKRGTGTIIGISSVAGDRGRGSNYQYGSAKAGFTAYLSGLRNRLFKHGVHVLTVKPGFVRTRMTAGMPLPGPLTATPDRVALAIVRAAERRMSTIYTLGVWRWIMLVIRCIPESIFKRLKL